jgi:thioredoxin 1
MTTPLVVTDETFDTDVLKSNVLTIVDFWAPWCAPCRMISPVLDEIAKEYGERLRLVKVNVDENHRSPAMYRVQSIPNLIFFKSGHIVDQVVGAMPKAELVRRIESLLI